MNDFTFMRIDKIVVFLNVLNNCKGVSRTDISKKCELSNKTLDRCIFVCKIEHLITWAGGDIKKQCYRITNKGREFLEANGDMIE